MAIEKSAGVYNSDPPGRKTGFAADRVRMRFHEITWMRSRRNAQLECSSEMRAMAFLDRSAFLMANPQTSRRNAFPTATLTTGVQSR